MKLKLQHKFIEAMHFDMSFNYTQISVYHDKEFVDKSNHFYDDIEEAMEDWLEIYNLKGKVPPKELCE